MQRSGRVTGLDKPGSNTVRSELDGVRDRAFETALYSLSLRVNQQIAFMADAEGMITYLAPLWGERTGTSSAAGLGRGFLDCVHPDDRAGFFDACKRTTRLDMGYVYNHRVRMADGSYRWFRCSAEKFVVGSGASFHWLGIMTDIDELFRARASAQASEKRFRTAALASRDVIWEADLQAGTVIVDETMRATFGHEVSGTPLPIDWWNEQIHPDDRDAMNASFHSHPAGRRWSYDYRFRRADGDYATVQSRAFIEHDEEGRAIRATGALSDLTEERLNQQRIERLQAEMLDTSRSGAAAALAAMLAHEINQPLTSLTNYVQGARRLIHQDGPLARDRVVMAIDAAAANALEAGAIVQRMRDLVSRGDGRLSTQDLWEIAVDVRTLAQLNTKAASVRIEIDEQLRGIHIIADRVQARQLFLNLLRNAQEALTDTPKPVIGITVVAAGEFVRVCVADNGSGFGTNKPDTLFTPFKTTKPNGVGLGLAICQMIVESNAGRIWAEERPGGGAAFYFTLPLADVATGATMHTPSA